VNIGDKDEKVVYNYAWPFHFLPPERRELYLNVESSFDGSWDRLGVDWVPSRTQFLDTSA